MITRYGAALIAASFASCCSFALAPGPVVVAKDGSGDFRTVQAAIDATSSTGAIIRIRPGTYEEKIVIDKPKIQLLGEGADPSQVVLRFNLSSSWSASPPAACTEITGSELRTKDRSRILHYGRSLIRACF